MSWYSNDSDIDFNEVVPIFLHIRECRNLQNLDLRLDGRYEFRLTRKSTLPRLEISANTAFVDLFEAQNIALTVLCGINGIGKTTILNLLAGRIRVDAGSFVVVFSDSHGRFLSNESIEIQIEAGELLRVNKPLQWQDSSLTGFCSNRVLHEGDEEFHILKNIADHYVRHRELYEDERNPLFTHVGVNFWFLSERCEEIANHLNDHLGWKVDRYEIEPYLKQHPVFFAFLTAAQDNTFDGFFRWAKQQQQSPKNLENLHALVDQIDPNRALEAKVLELIGNPVLVETKTAIDRKGPTAIQLRMENDFSRAFPIEDYDKASKRLYQLSEQIVVAVKRFGDDLERKLNHHFHVWPYGLTRILYLEPFRIMGRTRRGLYDLSSGELMGVKNRFELHPCMAQYDSCWLYRDEPDVHLHPEWKRQYVEQLIRAIEATRLHLASVDPKYGRKRYAIILTTHSPFILSDVLSDQAILLDWDQNERTVVRESSIGTFAGNIGAMFYDQFFMKETIGLHAEKTIGRAIERIESKKPLSDVEADGLHRLFSAVGDTLLRKLLLEKLDRKRHEKN